MSAIHSKNTRPERLLEKLLKRNKIKFKKHYQLTGSPDFVIEDRRIAIFVDGDFWHGHNWKLRGMKNQKTELDSYNKFWRNKIINNIKRDKKSNLSLKKLGWKVKRIWESDLKNNPKKIYKSIYELF